MSPVQARRASSSLECRGAGSRLSLLLQCVEGWFRFTMLRVARTEKASRLTGEEVRHADETCSVQARVRHLFSPGVKYGALRLECTRDLVCVTDEGLADVGDRGRRELACS